MKKLISLCILAVSVLSGCSSDDLFNRENNLSGVDLLVGQYTVSASEFTPEESQTRSEITKNPATDMLKFSWCNGDAIGVFPEEGIQMKFPLESVEASNLATFDARGWKLDIDIKYAAYYPFNVQTLNSNASGLMVPVSYKNQKQSGNGSTSHLGKYDYMVAPSTSPNGSTSINFDFDHVGSVLSFDLTIDAGSYKRLSLIAPEPLFVDAASLNVYDGTLTPLTYSSEVSLDLENTTVSSSGEPLTAFMMIAPADLSGKELTLQLVDENNNEYEATGILGSCFERGKVYSIIDEIEAIQKEKIAMLCQGPSFNAVIKAIASEDETVDENTEDYYIKKIVFDCNSEVSFGRKVNDDTSSYSIFANYNEEDGTVTISTSAEKIFMNKDASSCFYKLTRLQEIEGLDRIDTRYVTSMSGLFSDCPKLLNIDLSSFDTSNVGDMDNLFSNCQSLTELDVTGFNTSNVTGMAGMFDNCSSLTSLNVSLFDTRKVETMSCMFEGCRSLTGLGVKKFDTSNVKNMCQMFAVCSSLTELDVTCFDTRQVTDMSGMFMDCESLTTLNLTNFKTDNVKDMSSMFGFCESLTSLNLDNFNTSNVIRMDYMFHYCYNLESLKISNFKTKKVGGMREMFLACYALNNLDLSSFDTSLVDDMESMFGGCISLTTLNLSSSFVISDDASITDMMVNVGANAHCNVFDAPSSTINRIVKSDSGVNLDRVSFVTVEQFP